LLQKTIIDENICTKRYTRGFLLHNVKLLANLWPILIFQRGVQKRCINTWMRLFLYLAPYIYPKIEDDLEHQNVRKLIY